MIAANYGMNWAVRAEMSEMMHEMREMCAPPCCEGPSRMHDGYRGRDRGGFRNSEEGLGWGNSQYSNGEMNNSFDGRGHAGRHGQHNPVTAKIAQLQAEMQRIEADNPEAAARAQQWENTKDNPGLGIFGPMGGDHGKNAPKPLNNSIFGIKPDKVTADTYRLEELEHQIYQLQNLPEGGYGGTPGML